MKILLALPLLALLGVTLATPALKREAAQNHVSSTNCDNNGCHICVNGDCHYEPRGKREVLDDSNKNHTLCHNGRGNGCIILPDRDCGPTGCIICINLIPHGQKCHFEPYEKGCNATGCIRCLGLGNHGDGCEFVTYIDKREAAQNHVSSTNCDNHGCHICVNGNCHYEPRGKREAAQNHVSSTNCDNHGCHICVNGDCHYEPRGKREEFGGSNGTFEHPTGCNATGCTYCLGLHNCAPNCCRFAPYPGCNATGCIRCKGFGDHGDGCEFHRLDKREAAQNHVSSTNCDNHGCHICVNGNCHYEPRGKREAAQNHVSSTNCDNHGCHICVNGNCHYEPRGKREAAQNHVSSKNCDNNGCHICVNGDCHYEPSKREASEALEQNHFPSVKCIYDRCTNCVNGKCTHYNGTIFDAIRTWNMD